MIVGRFLAYVLNRANHTGTQDASTITGLTSSGAETTFLNFSASGTIATNSVAVGLAKKTGNIVAATIFGQNETGSATVEIWKGTTANIASATKISGTGPIQLTSAYNAAISSFPLWSSVAVTLGDFLFAKVTSTGMSKLTIALRIN